jgi:hypothetical protein
MDKKQAFSIVNLNSQDIPRIMEDTKSRYPFVPFGVFGHDDFFSAITMAHNTSTTNAACIEGVADLIYGKGLYTKNTTFTDVLTKIVPQEEIKRVAFDLKLFGNSSFQVYWNDEHTKIIKMYHIPVQYLRAEKIYQNPRIENYYYCTDWQDQRKIKDKTKIPAFGTSTEKMEILYIKNYSPNLYYYSLPDWIAAMQFAFVEAELSNLHLSNIENGFLPSAMINFNTGIPAPEERETIESLVQAKFTGTRNAGRFMLSFNDDPTTKPTIDIINIENLHEKYEYVADYAQQRLVVAHRVISPLLFGMTEKTKGFSSNSDEMTTAFSILQTMTIAPFQNILINAIDAALTEGGYDNAQLYFEQLTPLAILSQQAGDTGQSIEEVAQDTEDEMVNPATTDETPDTIPTPQGETQPISKSKTPISTSSQFFKDEYEITKQ